MELLGFGLIDRDYESASTFEWNTKNDESSGFALCFHRAVAGTGLHCCHVLLVSLMLGGLALPSIIPRQKGAKKPKVDKTDNGLITANYGGVKSGAAYIQQVATQITCVSTKNPAITQRQTPDAFKDSAPPKMKSGNKRRNELDCG